MTLLAKSPLNRIIRPEIKNDRFYAAILDIARRASVTTVLEIGSSAGAGSTEALVRGLAENPNKPTLFCIEVSVHRFEKLRERYRQFGFVQCYNASSVPPESFATEHEVTQFYLTTASPLNSFSLDEVLGWLRQDVDYVLASGVDCRGIETIKKTHAVEIFDMVLIDGSEFSGVSDFESVYGSSILMLDDVKSLKNWHNYQRLTQDPDYELLIEHRELRNGCAVFKKVNVPFTLETNEPVMVPLEWRLSGVLDRVSRKCGRMLARWSKRQK